MTKEEAIKIVRENMHPSYDKGNIFEALKTLVPELAESEEDEWIRKHIIEILERLSPCHFDGNEKARCIAYLERQKEHKPIDIEFVSDWLRKHIKTYINSEYNEFHKTVEYDGGIDIERLITDLKNAAEKEELFMGMKQVSETMEEKEQQSLSNMSLYDFVTRDLLQYGGKDFWKAPWALDSTGMGYPLYCAKLGAKWQREQKGVKWDESDDAIHTCVLGVLGKAFMGVLPTKPSQEHIEWFKSLPERFNLQPKVEWSEEDKRIIEEVDETLFMSESGVHESVKKMIEGERQWLNELPRRFKSLPRAAISEEALREGIDHYGITQHQIDNWLKKYITIA